MMNKYFKDYEMVWRYLESVGSKEDALEIIREERVPSESMLALLRTEIQPIFVPDGAADPERLSRFPDLGLVTKPKDGSLGRFLLEGRVILPIRGVSGNIFSIVGWYPDEKRYITAPSKYFSKRVLFYGLEQLSNKPKNIVLTEGIFDSIAVRSTGIPALGTMGVTVDQVKMRQLELFNKVLAIPDRDKTGKKVIATQGWSLPRGSTYLRLVQNEEGLPKHLVIKDIDDICKLYPPEDVRGILEAGFRSKKRVETLYL